MPCTALPRGFTDTKYPWDDTVQNNPCGKPIVTSIGGIDVSAASLCRPHWQMKNGQAPSAIDPYTVFLLHADGPDASMSFSDVMGHPLTVIGNAKISTAQSVFGGSSALFDGSNDGISTPDSEEWNFGSGDFTIDAWVRLSAASPNAHVIASSRGGPGDDAWEFAVTAAQTLRLYWSHDGSTLLNVTSGPTLSLNTWYHLAVVRSGGTITLFTNGVVVGSGPIAGAIYNSTVPLRIGIDNQTYNCIFGWLDEVRISKTARWTSAFTPPTAPYV